MWPRLLVEIGARAGLLAVEKDYSGAVNIGTGVETDINQLYTLLARSAGVDSPAQHAPGRPGEQLRSCVDNALARQVLGWQPTVEISEGLRRTVSFFREHTGR